MLNPNPNIYMVRFDINSNVFYLKIGIGNLSKHLHNVLVLSHKIIKLFRIQFNEHKVEYYSYLN